MGVVRRYLEMFLAILMALAIGSCFGGGVEGVRVAEVARGDVSKVVTAVGVLDAASPVEVTPAVSATIVSLPVKDGDYVQAGDVLAVLDEQELAAQAAQAKANYLTSAAIGDLLEGQWSGYEGMYQGVQFAGEVFHYMQAQIDSLVLSFYDMVPAMVPFLPAEQQEYLKSLLAEQRVDYMETMAGRPQLPQISYEGYPATASAADAARVEAAGYEYRKVQEGTKSPNICAPVSGYVVYATQQAALTSDIVSQVLGGVGSLTSSMGSLSELLGADLGAVMGGGAQGGELKVGSKTTAGKPLFQIVNLQEMKVKTEVEEVDVPGVKQGQEAKIYLDAYPDLTFSGKVVQVGVKAQTGSAGTTVFPVVVQMDKTDIPLRLGFNATVDITVMGKKDVISLPVTALMSEDGNYYVFVVKEGEARRREVTLGDRTREWVEVISGLEEGERVVIEGAGKVKEGQRVE
jgi:multidrug efflux pump subunit AcrA (membrane-fusion protein)